MSQIVREKKFTIENNADVSEIYNVAGMVFGNLEFHTESGTVPSGSFQVQVSTLKNDSYFENAKDASNVDVPAVAFSDTSRIFNLPVETMAKRRIKIKLAAAQTSGEKLFVTLTAYDNK